MILRMLKGSIKDRLALPTSTLPWTHSAIGLCVNWWGLGSSLRLIFFSFPIMIPYNHVLLILTIGFIHMSYRINKTISHVLTNYIQSLSHKLYLYSHPYLANCHLSNCTYSSYKLYLLILQIVLAPLANCHLSNCVSSFQCWAITYGLITRRAEVDLKSSPSVRVHFDGFSSDEVSEGPTFFYHFLLQVS